MSDSPNSPLVWRTVYLISAAMALSYIDRQALPVAIGAIQRDIPISNLQFSQLQAAFLGSYAVMYVIGGRMMDWLGTRRGFVMIVTWWSLACMSQGLATSVAGLMLARFLLGAGEAAAFPGATKAMTEGFSAQERSSAMGIIHFGTSVGSVAAPPLIAALVILANWRWVCVTVGALGLLWVVVWLRTAPVPSISTDRAVEKVQWLKLLSLPQVWGLFASKILYDAAFYFYLFWIPKYLLDARGFDIKHIGYYAWVPYAFHGLGGLTGGYVSTALIQRGFSLGLARKLVLGVSAAIMPVVLLIVHAPVQLAILLLSIAFFGQAVTSTMLMTIPADLFPKRVVGTVSGIAGLGGSIGGAFFGLVAGWILDQGHGYGPIFMLVASFHLVAFGIILATIRDFSPSRFLTRAVQ